MNRLAAEPSLYLRQHADNPVDWYPWGDEAFARAVAEDRPVLLSVGYSACHWCHVMAHESFEDEATAALMNALFVCVKVDREERPDVDALYMQATVAMSGHGGWPMTAFLTPEGRPYFAGTYFPPTARGGMPAFADVLRGAAHAYRTQPDDVAAQTAAVMERITAAATRTAPAALPLDDAFIRGAIDILEQRFDPVYGGFGGAPKFPPTTVLELLVQRMRRNLDDVAVRLMVDLTLTRMAEGGIHDHVGGGFHRYAVDGVWGVPHFEKMLYDNAGLADVYTQAYVATGDERWQRVAQSTLDYLLREMRLPHGGFAAAQDADTVDGEGAFFTWTHPELEAVLSGDALRVVVDHFGVRDPGPVEGRNVLAVARPIDAVAALTGITDADAQLRAALSRLYEARQARPQPGRDDKVVAAWNGMAIAAFANAGRVWQRDGYLDAARAAAELVWQQMRPDGRLARTLQDGRPLHPGQLDDHAHMCHGLVCLHQATLEEHWRDRAETLARQMLSLFGADDAPGLCATTRDEAPLGVRLRDLEDHPSASGNSQAARVLVSLATLAHDPDLRERAREAIAVVAGDIPRFPHAFGTALVAIDLLDHHDPEVSVAGDADDPATMALVERARTHLGPGGLVAWARDIDDRPRIDGRPTAYVCRNQTCGPPLHTPDELAAALTAPG